MIKDFITEDFENLDGLSEEKLLKLLHKAKDYEHQCWLEHQRAVYRCEEIQRAMSYGGTNNAKSTAKG